ncbi:MAG: arsenate reductase ArsC [Candidatus Zixiibacteriota bacterium]
MKVLILCTGNSCRSQMAERFFKYYLNEKGTIRAAAEVHSAGIEPTGINPYTVRVMREAGLDLSGQESKSLELFINEEFDYIITVCDHAAAKCPVFPGEGVRLHWPFEDPADATGTEEEILKKFRKVRDEIETRVKNWLRQNPKSR